MPTRCSKLDEVVLKIAGIKHRLWRAVEQAGVVLDVLVPRRLTKQATKRLRKLAKRQMRHAPYHDLRQACELRRGKEGDHARH